MVVAKGEVLAAAVKMAMEEGVTEVGEEEVLFFSIHPCKLQEMFCQKV